MNRETSIHSSDTLVVVDGSRGRRRLVIIGAIAALALLIIGLAVISHSRSSSSTGAAAGGSAGQIPTVTVIVPGRSDVGRVITASGALAAKRDQPIGIAGAGGRVVRVMVDAGQWVRAGQPLAIVDRSVQTEQASQLAAQIVAAKAQAALTQSDYDRAIALQDRGFISKADIDAKKAARDAAFAQVRVAEAQLGATRAQIESAQCHCSGLGSDPFAQRRSRTDRKFRFDRTVQAGGSGSRWKCRPSLRSRTSRSFVSACRHKSRLSARTRAFQERSGRFPR